MHGEEAVAVGGKKGNRTESTDYTGRSIRKFPIVAVPGFTSVTEPNQRMRYLLPILLLFLSVFYQTNNLGSRFFLFKYTSNLQYRIKIYPGDLHIYIVLDFYYLN